MAIIVALLAVILVFLLGAHSSTTNIIQTPTPIPTSNADNQSLATYNASQAYNLVLADITKQLGATEAKNINLTSKTFDKDATGKPATVAMLVLTDVPEKLDWEANLKSVIDFITRTDAGSPKWTYVRATDDQLNKDQGILATVITWEDSNTPVNPAVLEFTYQKTTDNNNITTLTIYVSAKVY